jgi:hypothetical protein
MLRYLDASAPTLPQQSGEPHPGDSERVPMSDTIERILALGALDGIGAPILRALDPPSELRTLAAGEALIRHAEPGRASTSLPAAGCGCSLPSAAGVGAIADLRPGEGLERCRSGSASLHGIGQGMRDRPRPSAGLRPRLSEPRAAVRSSPPDSYTRSRDTTAFCTGRAARIGWPQAGRNQGRLN